MSAGTSLVTGPGSDMVEVGTVYPINAYVFSGYLPANAAAVTLTVRDPQSASTTPTLVNLGTGAYQYQYPTTLVGRHVYTVSSTTPTLVSSSEFTVVRSGVT